MLTVTASHFLTLMVGEPVAYVQGFSPKGHRAVSCGVLTPRSPRDQKWSHAGADRTDFAGRSGMPRGTRHTLTGKLSWDARNHIHVLDIEGGGYWFVDLPSRATRLIGRQVTVEGVRSGFNMLDVHCVLAVDGATRPKPPRGVVARLLRRLRLT